MMRGLLARYQPGTRNAAVPDGAPLCGGPMTKKIKKFCPPCLGEAPRRMSFEERTIFRFGYELNRIMAVAQELLLFLCAGLPGVFYKNKKIPSFPPAKKSGG